MNSLNYFPADSYWHLRDPRLKLLVVIGGTTLALTENRLGGQLFLLIVVGGLYLSAQLPWKRGWRTLLTFRWLLLITLLLNLWTGPPVTAFAYLLRLSNILLLSSWRFGYPQKPGTKEEYAAYGGNRDADLHCRAGITPSSIPASTAGGGDRDGAGTGFKLFPFIAGRSR